MSNYLKKYFIFLCLGISISGIPIIYLYSAGEYVSLKKIVEQQSSTKIIYGTALHHNVHPYKKLLLKQVQPRIISLGSSRVMQFRQKMFVKKFINLGGAMNSINEGTNLVQEIIDNKPDMVIIGMDVWWFNDKYHDPRKKCINCSYSDMNINIRNVATVFNWLYEGKITLRKIFHTINSSVSDIGVSGQEKDGFYSDGSYYYTRLITGRKKHHDEEFKGTLRRIKNGNKRFEYSSLASNLHINNFIKLVKKLEDNDIQVVVFFPPFAKLINKRLNSMGNNYQYISDIKVKLHKNNLSFYDYTDVSTIDSSDCEFIDGFHGGDVTYARILESLSQEVPSLNNFVDQAQLIKYIKKYKGKAFIPDKGITSDIEVDFLGLGCEK